MRRRLCAVIASCLGAGAAHAQVSGSVALVSDYLYRGVSLSGGKPAPQLTLAYDDDRGWYGGVFASRLASGAGSSGQDARAQGILYAGYARRLASGLAWDAGLSQYRFISDGTRSYRELQVGVSASGYSARLSYAPDYMGLHARTVYAQASASHALNDTLSIFMHAGYLNYLRGSPVTMPRYRVDGRLGVIQRLGDWKLQLAWDGAHAGPPVEQSYGDYARTYPGSRGGFFLGVSRSF